MTTSEILRAFRKISALVVGDICLDRWCTYDPATAEPSRETGIPRIGVVATEVTPGAGGTVANNLAALGTGRVAVLGTIGEDGFGYELSNALAQRRISTELLVKAPGIQTFTYTKLINQITGLEDQPRIDFINAMRLDEGVERQIIGKLREAATSFDVVLVSDQAETRQGGLVTAAVRELLAQLACRFPDKVFLADSRARIELFRRMIIKPNEREARAACEKLFGRVEYAELLRYVRGPMLIVTYGPRGVLVVTPEGEQWVPTQPIENPVDICGAGDSFSAGAALALCVTRSPIEAARFGNLVASITIMKKGTGTASPEEVRAAAAVG